MRIYDHGTFEILVWEPRKVEVELHGEHLTGRWALFPIGRERRDERDWMIHRMGEPLDPDAEPMPETARADARPRRGRCPTGDGWAFEVKWDGVRAICRSEPGRLSLRSRSGADITAGLPGARRAWAARCTSTARSSTARSSRSTPTAAAPELPGAAAAHARARRAAGAAAGRARCR